MIFNDDQRKEILGVLRGELREAEEERRELAERWDKWRRVRELKPDSEKKNWPWEDASNVVTPLAATETTGIFASLKAASSAKKPFYTITSQDENLYKQAEVLTKYFKILVESKFHLDLRRVNNEVYYELVSLGTQFVQIPWVEDRKLFKKRDAEGNLVQAAITRRRGPGVIPIVIEDFFARGYVTDLQKATWIAIRHNLTLHELRDREAQGIFSNVEEIEKFYKSSLPVNWENSAKRGGITPADAKIYEIYEFYFYTDVDDDGVMEDVRFWVEPDSGVFLREGLNELGLRPVVRIPFIDRPKSLYGIGVGWLTEGMQDSCDALFNMAINSTHISSLQMFVTREGSNLGAKEKMYPFKQLTAEDPKNDILPLVFPNTAAANMQIIAVVREWADRLTGNSNAMMGMPDTFAKTRATASGTMFLAQQGSRLFNAIVENVEEAYDEIGMFIMFQMIMNKELVDVNLLPKEDRGILTEILNMEIEDIHLKFNFKISNTEIEETQEARRQQILTLAQLYSGYGKEILGIVSSQFQILAAVNPKALQGIVEKYVECSNQLLVGATSLMGQFFEFFNIEKKGLLPYMRDIEVMNEFIASLKDMQIARSLIGRGVQTGGGGVGQVLPGPGAGGGGLGSPGMESY